MKVFLASKVRKSVSKELIFTKSNFLGFINFGFLDLIDFAIVDRFSKFLPTLSLSTPAVPLGNS